jgi:hypothetical protein
VKLIPKLQGKRTNVFFLSFYVLLVCKCVLYYCHRVATQLQLTNISYHNIPAAKILRSLSFAQNYNNVCFNIFVFSCYLFHTIIL